MGTSLSPCLHERLAFLRGEQPPLLLLDAPEGHLGFARLVTHDQAHMVVTQVEIESKV